MADNVAITPGSGDVVHADEYTHSTLGSGKTQLVKLTDGTLGSGTPINVDIGVKANALRVAPASDITDATYIGDIKFGEALPAGTALLGKVSIDQVTANANEVVTKSGSVATVSQSTASSLKNEPAGNVAHDTADSGNPIKVGGKAKNLDGTAPGTAVAEDDRVDFLADVYGRQFVETTHPNLFSATDNQSSAQTNTQLKAAPGAGLSLYITDIVVSNGATAGNVKFVEDTAGTPVDRLEIMYFAANGGASLSFKTPIKITADKNFGYTSATVTTHSITISGFIAP